MCLWEELREEFECIQNALNETLRELIKLLLINRICFKGINMFLRIEAWNEPFLQEFSCGLAVSLGKGSSSVKGISHKLEGFRLQPWELNRSIFEVCDEVQEFYLQILHWRGNMKLRSLPFCLFSEIIEVYGSLKAEVSRVINNYFINVGSLLLLILILKLL